MNILLYTLQGLNKNVVDLSAFGTCHISSSKVTSSLRALEHWSIGALSLAKLSCIHHPYLPCFGGASGILLDILFTYYLLGSQMLKKLLFELHHPQCQTIYLTHNSYKGIDHL
jgi:hypothetical protein